MFRKNANSVSQVERLTAERDTALRAGERAREALRACISEREKQDDRLRSYDRQWQDILAALRQVTEFDREVLPNNIDYGNLTVYIRELVRDHEELEARIEAVLVLPSSSPIGGEFIDKNEVHRLLRGGTRVPDTVEEIAGG